MTNIDEASHPAAVIYCRVASATANGLKGKVAAQDRRCREFAAMRGYRIIGAFEDHASGLSTVRPGMDGLLSLLREHSRQLGGITVLMEDASRLARSVLAHRDLHRMIKDAGGNVEFACAVSERAPSVGGCQ